MCFIDGDPVLKRHAMKRGKESAERHEPLRKVVKEQGSSGSQNSDPLRQPTLAPFQIIGIGNIVRAFRSIILLQVEWRVREESYDVLIFDCAKELQAISPIEVPERGLIFKSYSRNKITDLWARIQGGI